MKLMRLWALIPTLFVGLLIFGGGISAASPAGAQSNSGAATAFVQEQFYIGADGGEVVGLAEFFADPMSYLRSEAAYTALRGHFASKLGVDSLSEAEFKALHTDGKVRLRPCAEVGNFRTDGIIPATGVVVQSPRQSCYEDEQFIEVQDGNGNWHVVASQGCYNPIRLVTAPPPPPKPAPECRQVPMDVTVIDGGMRTQHDSLLLCGGACQGTMYIPSYTSNLPSTQRADGFRTVCE